MLQRRRIQRLNGGQKVGDGPKVPAYAKTEGIARVCRLSALSVDRSLVSPLRQGTWMFLLHARQTRGGKLARQQRGPVWFAPDITGQNFKDEVSMAGEKWSNKVSEDSSSCVSNILSSCRPSRSSITISCFSSFFATQPLTGDSEPGTRPHRRTPALLPLSSHARYNNRLRARAGRLEPVLHGGKFF